MRTAVSIAELKLMRDAWGARLAVAAERWVEMRYAKASRKEIDEVDAEMRLADRELRKLNRRIRRRERSAA